VAAGLVAVLVGLGTQARAALLHRYNFNADAQDSVGAAHGTLMGGASLSGGRVRLGGAGQYVALPGGMLSGLTRVSVEFWASFGVNGNWPRVYDFGRINGTSGERYIFFSPHRGDNQYGPTISDGSRWVEVLRPGTLDGWNNLHVAVVYDPPGGMLTLYTNGVLVGKTPLTLALSSVANQVSFLGRSLYSADAYLNGSLNEFRLYDHALSAAEVNRSFTAGPDFSPESGPVTIVTQPVSTTISPGETLNLELAYTGARPVTLQWFRDGLPVVGATDSTFHLPDVRMTDHGAVFHAVLTNRAGGNTHVAVSSNAVLTVDASPRVITPPGNTSALLGASASFWVVAGGTPPLSYQWRHDSAAVPGATAPAFTVNDLQPSLAGWYDVVISNAHGSVTSAPARLDYRVPPPTPVNLVRALSDTEPFQYSYPASAIDRVTNGVAGWFGASNGGPATLVFQPERDLGFTNGTMFTFTLFQGTSASARPNFHLGRFRLSVTTDDRRTYAGGQFSVDRVAASWTVLEPYQATAANGTTLTAQPDFSLLANGGAGAVDTTYTITAYTSLTRITGFRLEALTDPGLPNGGPGRAANGAFHLQEVQVGVQPAWIRPTQDGTGGPNAVPNWSETSPAIRLEKGGEALELVVPAEPNPGVVLLWGDTDLERLGGSPGWLWTTNAPITNDLRLPLTPDQRGFFYAVRRNGATLEDPVGPEDEDARDVAGEEDFALWTLGLPETLASNVEYTADFLLMGGDETLLAFDGTARLTLVSRATGLPHPEAVIAPGEVRFVQGAGRLVLRVAAPTSLDGYWIALEFDDPRPGGAAPRSVHLSASQAGSKLVKVPIIQLPDSSPTADQAYVYAKKGVEARVDSSGWSNPLPGGPPEVAGTFGEWRGCRSGNVPHARTHRGLDLVADPGTQVKAARGGIVAFVKKAKKGNAKGPYVVINHLDGEYTRYLHLSTEELARTGTYAKRGEKIGRVGKEDETGVAPHLHFEIRRHTRRDLQVATPGTGQDPLKESDLFPLRPGVKDVAVLEVGVTTNSPGTFTYGPPSQPGRGNGQSAYLLLQLAQREPKVNPTDDKPFHYLAPRRIRFVPEQSTPRELMSPSDDAAIDALLPAKASAATDFGFARYKHGEAKDWDREDFYRYWFRWDVSSYAANPNGPRKFTIETETIWGRQARYSFKWGPEILGIDKLEDRENLSWYRVRFRGWVGEDASTPPDSTDPSPWRTGRDWYRLILPEGGIWRCRSDDIPRVFDEVASGTTCADDFPWERVYTFTFDPSSSSGTEAPKLRIESATVPTIADEMPLCGDREFEILANGQAFPLVEAGDVLTFTRTRRNPDGTHTPVAITEESWLGSLDVNAIEEFGPSAFTVARLTPGGLIPLRQGQFTLHPRGGGCIIVRVKGYIVWSDISMDHEFNLALDGSSLGYVNSKGNALGRKLFSQANGSPNAGQSVCAFKFFSKAGGHRFTVQRLTPRFEFLYVYATGGTGFFYPDPTRPQWFPANPAWYTSFGNGDPPVPVTTGFSIPPVPGDALDP
jgi:murein DD-endopeptidase MepM/ murein hydrolase activator NlpD